jgi:hypothetical protein
MTHKAITLQFVVPAVLAVIALGISIGAVYLTVKYLVLIDRSEARHSAAAGSLGIADLPNPDGRFSRVYIFARLPPASHETKPPGFPSRAGQ